MYVPGSVRMVQGCRNVATGNEAELHGAFAPRIDAYSPGKLLN